MARRKLLLLIAVMLVALLFTTLNPQTVQLEIAFAQVRVRLGVVLVIAAALGLIFGIFVHGLWVTELLSERGRLRRALKAAEAKARALATDQSADNSQSTTIK